jgi:hypothetical protein
MFLSFVDGKNRFCPSELNVILGAILELGPKNVYHLCAQLCHRLEPDKERRRQPLQGSGLCGGRE